MKHFSIIDIVFFILLGIFLSLGGYEIFRFLAPYYHFWYVFTGAIFLCMLYWVYKFESGSILARKIFGVYTEKKDFFLTVHLLVTLTIIVLSFYVWKFHFISWGVSLFFLHFIFAKIQGYDMHITVKWENIYNLNAWRIFLISYAGFIIICSAMFREFFLEPTSQRDFYVLASLLYITFWVAVFFDIRQLFQRNNRRITEIFLVLILLATLGYIVFELIFSPHL